MRDLGYYIAPNDYWDATAAVDLRQRSGWLGRLQLNYALRYRFNGTVNARLENRQSGSAAQRNWRIDFNHSQQMGRDANLRASGTFQSNESFGLDNSARLNERLNRTLRSNFSYSRRFRESGNSLSLNASQTKNLDTQTHDIVLPELSFRKGRQPLWGRGKPNGQQRREKAWYERIYYDGNARLRNGERGTLTDTTRATRADLGMRVTAQYPAAQLANVEPHTGRVVERRRSAQQSSRGGARRPPWDSPRCKSDAVWAVSAPLGAAGSAPARAKARTQLKLPGAKTQQWGHVRHRWPERGLADDAPRRPAVR